MELLTREYAWEGVKQMSCRNINDIEKDKFRFVNPVDYTLQDKTPVKTRSYSYDAFRRFCKNKSSVAGTVIILVLVLFAVLMPIFSPYDISDRDGYYSFVLPKNSLLVNKGFWDGCKNTDVNRQKLDLLEATPGALVEFNGKNKNASERGESFSVRVDSYAAVGFINKTISDTEYKDLLEYEKNSGIQVMFPLINESLIKAPAYLNNANAWFLTDEKGVAIRDFNGNFQDIYLYEDGMPVYSRVVSNGTHYNVRVLYSEYYKYINGEYASFLFGADAGGYDICTRLAYGARLSLVLSLVVSFINLVIGVFIGALEGYYGGKFDLIFERIKDFIWEIPSVVIFALFQMYLASKAGPVLSLIFAFVCFGWIGISNVVRAQFYRFKGREYVMAARTLGAKDSRIIWRHIMPNAAGYIITASVLTIPGVIFSEASLSYMGIVNLQSDNVSSIGTMLNNGQETLSMYPHCVFFPALFIALLLICMNLFGNGLRDALNPTVSEGE